MVILLTSRNEFKEGVQDPRNAGRTSIPSLQVAQSERGDPRRNPKPETLNLLKSQPLNPINLKP